MCEASCQMVKQELAGDRFVRCVLPGRSPLAAAARVLAGFVLKYTLTAGSQPPRLHEVVDG